jgi:hypothetical protein
MMPLGSGKLEQVLGLTYVRVRIDKQLDEKPPKMTEVNWKEIGTAAEIRQRTEPVPKPRPFAGRHIQNV